MLAQQARGQLQNHQKEEIFIFTYKVKEEKILIRKKDKLSTRQVFASCQ